MASNDAEIFPLLSAAVLVAVSLAFSFWVILGGHGLRGWRATKCPRGGANDKHEEESVTMELDVDEWIKQRIEMREKELLFTMTAEEKLQDTLHNDIEGAPDHHAKRFSAPILKWCEVTCVYPSKKKGGKDRSKEGDVG